MNECKSLPFTSTFAKSGKVVPNFFFANFLMSASEPGSWLYGRRFRLTAKLESSSSQFRFKR